VIHNRVTIEVWRTTEFAPGSRPTAATVRRWIDGEKLPGGEKIGTKYYVDLDVWHARGNPLVLKVLQAA
jgi:hypothetical protein